MEPTNLLLSVQQADIVIERLTKVVDDVNGRISDMVANMCEQAHTTQISKINVDGVEVDTKVYIRKGIKVIECKECGEMLQHVGDHTIRNLNSKEEILLSNYAVHLLKHEKNSQQNQIFLLQAQKVFT